MQINKLKNSCRVTADKIYGKYTSLGRSYGRYDVGHILLGSPKTIELPWTLKLPAVPPNEPAISENAGEMPNKIFNQGHAPYTYFFVTTDQHDGLYIDVSGITEYLAGQGNYTGCVDLHFSSSSPTSSAFVAVVNGENTEEFYFNDGNNLRIKCYMAERKWLVGGQGSPILLPVYMRPQVPP